MPRNPRNIREFLGLVGYYRKFIAEFARRTKPLSDLLKQGREFHWGSDQQRSFDDMKDALSHAPILQFPDFEQPFVLTTDASDYAIGAVLSQGKLGHDLPVAYASRLLTKAERNYSATERECLAVVEYVRHFRHYLYGQNFIVVTDHQALRWLHSVKDPSSRLMRWRLKLRDFQYEIVYKSGKTNKNADALSRNTPEMNDVRVQEIRVLPLSLVDSVKERRRRGRPKREVKGSAETSDRIQSETKPDESGIASRVRMRNQSRLRPSYKEPTLTPHRGLAHSTSDSDSDSTHQIKRPPGRPRIFRKRTLRYEDDDDYAPPTSVRNQPISIESMFEEQKSDEPSPVEMIIDVDPTLLPEQSSDASNASVSHGEGASLDTSTDSELEFDSRLGNSNRSLKETLQVEDQNDTLEETLRPADCEREDRFPIKIIPRELNPSDSESVYSEIEREEEETITPTTCDKTPNKHHDSSTVPETPDLSYHPSNSQSTPIEPPVTNNSVRKMNKETVDSPLRPPRKRREKQIVTLGLYETIPPEPIVSSYDDRSIIPPPREFTRGQICVTNDSLAIARDNYSHFISADCNLSTPMGRLLSDLGYINEINLREQQPHKGSVIVSQCGEIKIFSLICQDQFYDLITEDDLYIAMNGLKEAMYQTKTRSVRIPGNDNGLNKLPENALRNIIRRVFSGTDLSVILCLGKVETPPPEKRKEIVQELHRSLAGGHKGCRKTYRRVRERFYWPDMVREIQEILKTCRSCQLNKLVRIKTRQPMVLTDTPADAFDKVCLDTVGPLTPTPNGNRHILTMQCNLTKYCLAVAVPDIRAITIADAFAREFIAVFGCPRAILSDRGTSFLNKLLGKLTKIFKIKQLTTSGYHPQTNGSLERSHQVLSDYLKHYLRDNDDWDTFLPYAMLSYNTTVHEGTKFSPYHLVFGKEARLPSAFPSEEVLETYGSYLSELVTRLDKIRAIAAKNIVDAKIRSKHYYDRNLNEKEFELGDLILCLREPRKNKFERYYDGPLEIVEVHNKNNVVLKDPTTGKRILKHIDKIKHYYHDSSDEFEY